MRWGPISYQRWGTARSSPDMFGDPENLGIVVGGTYRPNCVVRGSLSVSQVLNAGPSTARLTVFDFTPVELQEILIYANYAERLLFGGSILRISQTSSRKNGQLFYVLQCTDWTNWVLRNKLVFARYVNTAADTVFKDLVTNYAPAGFTAPFVASGAPNIDIAFSGENLTQALDAVAAAANWRWWCDPEKRLYFFNTDPGLGTPDRLDTDNYLYDELVYEVDASQWRTAAYVVGKSTRVTAAAAVGQTYVDVDDSGIFNYSGVTAGTTPFALTAGQVLTYTTIPTGTRIGGIPAAGTGSIQYALRIGDQISVGCYYLDAAKVAILGGLDATDGERPHFITDGSLEADGCSKRAIAEVDVYGVRQITGSYLTYDQTTRPGQRIEIWLPPRADINAVCTVQQVDVTQSAIGRLERRVRFSNQPFPITFRDVLVPADRPNRRRGRR